MKLILLGLALLPSLAAQLSYHEAGFCAETRGNPHGWTTWSARPEIAPRTFVDASKRQLRRLWRLGTHRSKGLTYEPHPRSFRD